jgi:hypothetical protein
MKNREKKQNGDIIDLNYPPKDMSMEELEEWWGDPSDIVPLRKRKWKESDARPNLV